jgi:hypothetical protein
MKVPKSLEPLLQDGLIDEVRVSNRQLAESELLINAPEFR